MMVEWNSLQKIGQGFNLNDLLNEDFLKYINEEFEGKRIDITNIQFSVRDDKINQKSDETFDLISMMNRNVKDTLLNQVVIDVNIHENLDKIINAINKFEE